MAQQAVKQNESKSQGWSGRTDEVVVPQLGADFWSEGKSVEGVLDSWRETSLKDGKTGVMYKLKLPSVITIGDNESDVVELPALTGVKMAIKSLKSKGYTGQKGDVWNVVCTGIRKATQQGYSDSPEFEIQVIRKAF
jgi:hypothetical protein